MARLSIRQAAKTCHRLGISLNAGVDVLQVLQREAEHGPRAFRRNMTEVGRKVSHGASLAEALRECDCYFPPLMYELIGVGEETGRLDRVLLRLAEHYEQLVALRRKFLAGLLWPALELCAAILVIGALIALPPMLFGVSIPVFGLSGARGASIYFGIVFAVVLGGAVIGYGLTRGWFGTLPGRLIVHVPVVGKAIKTMALARHAWTLSLALDAGVDARRAMRLALQSTRLRYFTQHIEEVAVDIQRGSQFHEALQRTRAFPPEFLSTLQNAELSGTEGASLSRLSEEYQQQAESAATTLAVVGSMIIMGLVFGLLIFMVFYLVVNLYLKPLNEALEMTR
ncbi:MAG: type II secretion system F family protein [Planctomycetota bacterium]